MKRRNFAGRKAIRKANAEVRALGITLQLSRADRLQYEQAHTKRRREWAVKP